MKKAFFVASTGQHVGKTTTCLGLLSGLKKRYAKMGFIKPVGQEQTTTDDGTRVDKDVLLFKETFNLQAPYRSMSPVLFPQGFTRDYLDGKVSHTDLSESIKNSYRSIAESSDCVIVEGTGHVGVGSVCDLSNAHVAKMLGLDMVLIASGGLGSSFDALAVNKAFCDQHGIRIAGVILNRVLDDKRKMVVDYMQRALDRWNTPILGVIPYDPFLSNPSVKDFESLFDATLLSGEKHHLRHFRHTRLVATPVGTYESLIRSSQLVITPSSREDIIAATIIHARDKQNGMILTGEVPPSQEMVHALRQADIPMLYVPMGSYRVMKKIMSYTVKIQRDDVEKIQEAISLVESHIDFDQLCSTLSIV